MRDFRDAKAMAKTLREALHAKSVVFTNSESQELVAFRQLESLVPLSPFWMPEAASLQPAPPRHEGLR
jgi:hypothetical protein